MSKLDSTPFVTPLTDLAVVSIEGADAADFLHAQLTHDIASLDDQRARLNGYCTAKGRLLATLVVWRDGNNDSNQFYALVRSDIADALIKRLSMFVFRSKVKISLSPKKVTGVSVGPDKNTLADLGSLTGLNFKTRPDSAAWQAHHTETATLIAAPSAHSDTSRWWLIDSGPATDAAVSDARWQVEDIAAGLPWINSAIQELFIPQTLNLDLIDAVSFTKGCYPGQEVVARSHYRGTIKRRMAYGICTSDTQPDTMQLAGIDIFNAHKPGSPCGRIINAARYNGQWHLLLEIQLADLDNADFRLESPAGAPITIQTLPYSLLPDTNA